MEENAIPDSRPRPPLLAWDGIVIANADFAAMVAAAVNATSAERREADSLSPDGLRSSRRRRLPPTQPVNAHARNGQYHPSRARQSPHTRRPSSHPSSSTFHRASFVPIHPSADHHPLINRSSPPSARASRVRSSRAHSRVPREGQWCERSSRTSWSSSSSCVARARAHTSPHPPARPDRVSPPSRSRFTNHDSSMCPHTRDARSFDRDRETTTVRGLERV